MPPQAPEQSSLSTPSHSNVGTILLSVMTTLAIVLATLVIGVRMGYLTMHSILPINAAQDVRVSVQEVNPNIEVATETVSVRDGVYALTGHSGAQGSGTYTGTVEIRLRSGTTNVYDLTWQVASGQEQWGVGIFRDGVLSVGYFEQAQGEVRDAGVVSFVASGDLLLGEWSSLQGGGAGIEELRWLSQ